MNDYKRRFEAATTEVNEAGIWSANSIPLYVRMMRKLGFQPKPPHYRSFLSNLLGMGIFFALFWGVTMYFSTWRADEKSVAECFILALVAGMVFGGFMAVYYHRSAKRHSLTRWEAL